MAKQQATVHYLGIRHHGPGSARRVLAALQRLQPDLILLEGVEEGASQWVHVGTAALRPPLALLVYEPKSFSRAVYYPFAEFSPEWQALAWANTQGCPARPMDLPQTYRLAEGYLQDQAPKLLDADTPRQPWEEDPLGYLAQLAGYADYERWWEAYFEHVDDELEVFALIAEMMQELRQSQTEYSPEDKLREAYMRKTLRQALKEGFQNIVVICGAWHVPALMNHADIPQKNDAALLKGLPKIKLEATWIPWTSERLSLRSGYGAGIHAPAWYALLFADPQTALLRFMAQASTLLREQDQQLTGSASVIEAIRLADTLATLRKLRLPGLQELQEACLTLLCQGSEAKWALIEKKLLLGQDMGEVDSRLPRLPLQADIERQTQSLRLKKYLSEEGWLKAAATKPQGGLDLREDFDRQQSAFLHRLLALDIPWGKPEEATGRELSSKNEYWYMAWQPEFALKIIESAVWGNTLEAAATARLLHRGRQALQAAELAEYLQQSLRAELPAAFGALLAELQNLAALSRDIPELLSMLPLLLRIWRYGDVRRTDTSAVADLLSALLPRICAGLPLALRQLNEEAVQNLARSLQAAHQTLLLAEGQDWLGQWLQALADLGQNLANPPLLRGLAWRLQYNANRLRAEDLQAPLAFALSAGQSYTEAAQWLEGFLGESGLLLVHQPSLYALLDAWVETLDEARFVEVLPLLRRSFARFAAAERRQLLQLAELPRPDMQGHKASWQFQAASRDKARLERFLQGLQSFW